MNKAEARRVAYDVAARYRARPRNELLRLLNAQDTFEHVVPSGSRFQIEVMAAWDDKKGENLRVFVSVDDGGLSAFSPLTVDFILAPDGRFVGET